MLLVLYLKTHCQGNLGFLLLSSRSFIVLHFAFRFMIHFELIFLKGLSMYMGFPSGSVVKNWPAKPGDSSSIPGSGRSPGANKGPIIQVAK